MRIAAGRLHLVVAVLTLGCALARATPAPVPMRATVWQCVEISFTSTVAYARPFYDVGMIATFQGPGGRRIDRPAFWDGGNSWKVRFAATSPGRWTYVTNASDPSNKGLQGIAGTLDVSPYTGDLAIYKHGFVTISPNRRYFVYADGTPFFYLGDTHWFAQQERFETSNLPGCPSQFKRYVDRRVSQGFTVYQTEWGVGGLGPNPEDAGFHWSHGIDESEMPAFHNVDRKFGYLAGKGMVIANAMAWRTSISGYDDPYIRKASPQLVRPLRRLSRVVDDGARGRWSEP